MVEFGFDFKSHQIAFKFPGISNGYLGKGVGKGAVWELEGSPVGLFSCFKMDLELVYRVDCWGVF